MEQNVSPDPIEEAFKLSKKQFESSKMKLGELEMADFRETIRAIGVMAVPPDNKASVSSYFGGTVREIRVISGEYVKQGQTLFTLENPDFVQMQQDYLEAKGQLAYLKSDYERQRNLSVDNVSSQKNFLKAESDYTVTRVKVESLGKKLSLLNINSKSLTIDNIQSKLYVTSPISGFVTKVDINLGAVLNPSQPAITLVNTEHLYLDLNVFEKDLPKISVGQQIHFNVMENKIEDYVATVHLINKTVDLENRMISLHGQLSNKKLSARFGPGMYVEANIYSAAISKTALPEDALVEVDGKFYVLTLKEMNDDGYEFLKREVEIGESMNGYVEIVNQTDFSEHTQFLITGAFNLITE